MVSYKQVLLSKVGSKLRIRNSGLLARRFSGGSGIFQGF